MNTNINDVLISSESSTECMDNIYERIEYDKNELDLHDMHVLCKSTAM